MPLRHGRTKRTFSCAISLAPPSRGRTLKSGSRLLHLLREHEGSAPLHSRVVAFRSFLSNTFGLISCRSQLGTGIQCASKGSDHGNVNCKSSGADLSPSRQQYCRLKNPRLLGSRWRPREVMAKLGHSLDRVGDWLSLLIICGGGRQSRLKLCPSDPNIRSASIRRVRRPRMDSYKTRCY